MSMEAEDSSGILFILRIFVTSGWAESCAWICRQAPARQMLHFLTFTHWNW